MPPRAVRANGAPIASAKRASSARFGDQVRPTGTLGASENRTRIDAAGRQRDARAGEGKGGRQRAVVRHVHHQIERYLQEYRAAFRLRDAEGGVDVLDDARDVGHLDTTS
jgi:hypothetical protein